MITYDLNAIGVNTTILYSNTNKPILVGDNVRFIYNDYFGEVEGIICFNNGSFGARITKHKSNQLIGNFISISPLWEKIEEELIIEDSIYLTKELIHQCATPRGGFTTAQVEYLGFSLKETWIKEAVGLKVTKEQLNKFKDMGNVNSKELKRLKESNMFYTIKDKKSINKYSYTQTMF